MMMTTPMVMTMVITTTTATRKRVIPDRARQQFFRGANQGVA
jgi:hypothetical protein